MSVRRGLLREATAVALAYTAFFVAFFAPVLFGPALLAPDDGFTYFLPAFLAGPTAWTDLLFAGYPVLADPQTQSFYPVARLFALLPGAWDAYVVSAYVLASSFAYGYARALGASCVAAAAAGLVYGTSGFLVAHLRHASFIHAAAWLPALLWALERLRISGSGACVAATAAATALLVVAGSPQLLVYSLGLAAAYAVLLTATRVDAGSRRPDVRKAVTYLTRAAAGVAIGVGLGAVQLLPAAELTAASPRATFSAGDFGMFALSGSQLPLLLFPYAQGGAFGVPYAGPWNLAELAGWVGVMPLLAAGPALVAGRSRGRAWFWVAVVVVGILLALGNATPFGRVPYYVPGYGLFKAPGRHFLEVSMAASALTALGIDAIRDRESGAKALRASAAVVTALFAAALAAVLAGLPAPPASSLGGRPLAAVALPLAALAVSAGALLLWRRRPASAAGQALLLTALALDLSSFAWFFEWRMRAPSAEALQPPDTVIRLGTELQRRHQRMLSSSGHVGWPAEVPVNLSRAWGVPSAAGYSPLMGERLGAFVPMPYWGAPTGPWAASTNQALDLLSVRYVTITEAALRSDSLPPPSAEPPMGTKLGDGCGEPTPPLLTVDLPEVRADSLEIVTSLGCSTSVPQGAPVLDVRLGRADAPLRVLRAGVDTAEWAYDCPDVRPAVRHERPPPLGGWPLPPGSPHAAGVCRRHAWRVRLPLPENADGPLRLRWVGPSGAIYVHRVALTRGESGIVLNPELEPFRADGRWRRAGQTRDGVLLYENLRALPRAWLVPRAVVTTPAAALRAVHESTLPDGSEFRPREVALVEQAVELPARANGGDVAAVDLDDAGGVTILRRAAGAMEMRVNAPRVSLLVTSDVWYPGWKAWVDGRPTPVLRVDYVLRGIVVPSGTHDVRFAYEPVRLRDGTVVSAFCVILLGALLISSVRRDERRS